MNYASIRHYDIANGEGVRVSLFVSGCNFHCPGCFNPEAQDFNYGEPFTHDVKEQLLEMVSEETISGLSILGGDPLCQDVYGLMLLSRLCQCVHRIGKTVWLWTGYKFEDVMSQHTGVKVVDNVLGDKISKPGDNAIHRDCHKADLLANCDVVVDGPFQQDLADRALKWRGSANQRIIDVQKTLKTGGVILYEK